MQWQIFTYDTIDSTSTEAWRRITQSQSSQSPSQSPAYTAIIARQQTQGRGQRGNVWQSSGGGLYLSVILPLGGASYTAPQITLWVTWGIAARLRETGLPVQIKWLNDLVIDGRKIGGILTETRSQGGNLPWAVVGVGINWLNEVPAHGLAIGNLPSTMTCLTDLEQAVLNGITLGEQTYIQQGIEPILATYLQWLDRHEINHNGQRGLISAITPAGELVVKWQESNSMDQSSVERYEIYPPGTISLGYPSQP
jgi:BirA family transcriptional regulator, biotin operon repressor / biotin---[acetyl-CoA-carboxylase] ligase